MGRDGDARDLEHHAAAGQDLRERGDRAGALFPERRTVRGLVRRQEGQIPEAARRHAAQGLKTVELLSSPARGYRYVHYVRTELARAARASWPINTSNIGGFGKSLAEELEGT